MIIDQMQSTEDITNYISRIFMESDIDTFNKIIIATDQCLTEGRNVNSRLVTKNMKTISKEVLEEKMNNDYFIERVTTESIPKLSKLLTDNSADYVLNKESYFGDIMRMIFGPREFSVSSGIMHSNAFSDSFDITLGTKYNKILNTLIEEFNPAIVGTNIKKINESLPLSKYLEEFDDTLGKVIKYYTIDLSSMNIEQFTKLRLTYDVINEEKGMMSKLWSSFTGALSSIGSFVKTQYEKLKYFWKDTYDLTTEINNEYKRLGDVKIYGRDGLTSVLSIPVAIIDEIVKTSDTIKQKANSVASQQGVSIDFKSFIKTVGDDINRLSDHVENKLISTMGKHQESFSQGLFITYTKSMKHIINSMGDMYKHIISVEKDLTAVKFSGDDSKKQVYSDMINALSMLKGLLGKLESNFNQIVQKYIAVLKMALQILNKKKDNPDADSNSLANKTANVGNIRDGEDNRSDSDMDNMDGMNEALTNCFKYYYNQFVETDTINVYAFERMLESYFDTDELTAKNYKALEELVSTRDVNNNILNESHDVYLALSKPILENIRGIKLDILPAMNNDILLDHMGNIITSESLREDMEYVKNLALIGDTNLNTYAELQYKYSTIETADPSTINEGFSDNDREHLLSVSTLIANNGGNEETLVAALYRLKSVIQDNKYATKIKINRSRVRLAELVLGIEEFFTSLRINKETMSIKYNVSEFIMSGRYSSDDVEYVYTDDELIGYASFIINILLTKDCMRYLAAIKEHSNIEYSKLVMAMDAVITELASMS